MQASPRASVTAIAVESGFSHLGRFSLAYNDRYGESPSATLRYGRATTGGGPAPFRVASFLDRPTMAIPPFDLIGAEAGRSADLHYEVARASGCTG